MNKKSFTYWWASLPKSSKISISITSALLLIAIPLSIYSATNEVSVSPRAYQTIGLNGSKSNFTFGSSTETIQCTLGNPCKVNFEGESKNPKSNLSMTFDFLPPGLTASTCLPYNSEKSYKLTCGFEGVPQKTGRFQIQANLTEGDKTKTTTYTLQIR